MPHEFAWTAFEYPFESFRKLIPFGQRGNFCEYATTDGSADRKTKVRKGVQNISTANIIQGTPAAPVRVFRSCKVLVPLWEFNPSPWRKPLLPLGRRKFYRR